ncbi:CDGSH iron-sulfur domain-containing protein [Mangrovitalea sediminis]|uniref:CDGSH iron-sulfur domain-containing protein n=1 Tax=Mangrovitalea sediminis TaxID=1982043 RepID=UPI000BE4CEBC|nr:CDGSH iron-sulfur domain-containing protein [Mangrovitalea sediminis]
MASRQLTPFAVQVVQGKRYYWCACGRSQHQPFCDGSHEGSAIRPLVFVAERNEYLWLCGCKRSGTPPFCDGTHKRLSPDEPFGSEM